VDTSEQFKTRFFYICCALFIAINAIFVAQEFYYFSFLPLVLFILFWFFFSLDKFIFLIAFTTPLSVKLEDFDINIGISIPTEPLMFAVLLLFLVKLFYDISIFDKKIFKHPITIAIIINLIWIFITSITSEFPIVSIKFLISRLWAVVTFFFFGITLFKEYKNIKKFIWLYCIPLAAVIIYITFNHYQYGFDRKVGTWIVHPFFNDHTAYGCVIALFIPFIVSFIFNSKLTKTLRFAAIIILAILITGILLSYCRAALVSLAGILAIFIVLKLKINYKIVLLVLVFFAGLFMLFQTELIMELEKNKQDSSSKYSEHIQSISNISTDASNLERINRWASALRMFKEKPFFGWGPGTYQLVYAPFQYSKEKTIISTNAGDMGNAHSEYIGPLAESGVLGMLSILFLVFSIIYTGVKVYKNTSVKEVKVLTLGAFLGLCGYFIHGIMNDFLDTDKASVPFWGFAAILVVMDIYHKDTKEEKSESKS